MKAKKYHMYESVGPCKCMMGFKWYENDEPKMR